MRRFLSVLALFSIMTILFACGGGGTTAVTDTTAPIVTAFTMPATATSLTVAVTTFTATDDIAVTGYLITESATAPTYGAAGWTAAAPISYTFAAAGTQTAYAWAKDAAGNVSISKSATVTNNRVALNGTVSAPGGSLAFNKPSGLKRFFAKFLPADAMASNPRTSAICSGVTVNLIQIDDTGAQVGSVLATSTTDALGNYILHAPAGFVPASNYVVRAVGTGVTLQSFATGTTIDVDQYTQTTVLLITGSISSTSGASITRATAADVAAALQTVTSHSADVSATSTNINTLVADLRSAVNNSTDSSNIIASIASPFGITGTVTDSSNNPIANIKIAVMTYVERVTQAIIITDAAGRYTVRVPAGDYVLAAINNTSSSPAASAWWTSGGGTTSMWSAEKITVAGAMVTKDIILVPGGRISGKITAKADGSPLNGIHIRLRDFTNSESLMNVRTGQDGTYNFNVAPGSYYISAMNGTLDQSYATEVFNSPNGGTNMTQAQKLVIAAGNTYTANMSLLAGSKIEGTVTDENGSPIAGINIRVRDTTDTFFVEGQSSGKDGRYRFWLRPGIYKLRARGQTSPDVDISTASASAVVTFNAAVSQITAKLLDTNGAPVSQAYADVYNAGTGSWIGYEHSNGDGSVTVYSDPATPVAILFKISSGDPIGSSIYLNKTRAGLATAVTAPTALGTVTLPAGGVLNGIVTKGGVPVAGALIQVRDGAKSYGTLGIYRFVNVRTMSDGSYTVSLPLGVQFDRICAVDTGLDAWTTCTAAAVPGTPNGIWTAFDNMTLSAPATTKDFAF